MKSDSKIILNDILALSIAYKSFKRPVILRENYYEDGNEISDRMDRLDAKFRKQRRRVK